MSRLLVGAALLSAAVISGLHWLDVLVGLVVANVVVIAGLWLRGSKAPPLRAAGPLAHCLNCASIAVFFVVMPVAAFLFYGSAMVVAAITGVPGCEVSAVSNLVRRRRDEIGCPLFAPIDAIDARAAAS